MNKRLIMLLCGGGVLAAALIIILAVSCNAEKDTEKKETAVTTVSTSASTTVTTTTTTTTTTVTTTDSFKKLDKEIKVYAKNDAKLYTDSKLKKAADINLKENDEIICIAENKDAYKVKLDKKEYFILKDSTMNEPAVEETTAAETPAEEYAEPEYEEEYYEEPVYEETPVVEESPAAEPAPESNHYYGEILSSYVDGAYYMCDNWKWNGSDWYCTRTLSDPEAVDWVESTGYMKPNYLGTEVGEWVSLPGFYVYLG